MADKTQEINENELLSWAETKMGHLKPYMSRIALFAAILIVAFAALLWYLQARRTNYANQWRELNISFLESRQNQNTGRLLEVAETYPEQPAGLWSLMLAGDYDLKTGLLTMATDRSGAFKMISKAKESFEAIVNSNSAQKSTDLQRRSLFSLAYAEESLGEFEKAAEHYKQLRDGAPESAFASIASRGLARCENPQLVSAYQKLLDWKDPINEEAPGPNVSERPNIEIPDFDFGDDKEPLGAGGGDFSDEGEMKKEADPAKEADPTKEATDPAKKAADPAKETVDPAKKEEPETKKADPPKESEADAKKEADPAKEADGKKSEGDADPEKKGTEGDEKSDGQ